MDLSQEDMRLSLVKGETLSTPSLIQPYSSQKKTQMSRIYAQEPQQCLTPQQQRGVLKTMGVPMLLSSLLYSFVWTSSFSERSVPYTKVYNVTSQKIWVSSDREDGRLEERREETYKAIKEKLPVQDCFVYPTYIVGYFASCCYLQDVWKIHYQPQNMHYLLCFPFCIRVSAGRDWRGIVFIPPMPTWRCATRRSLRHSGPEYLEHFRAGSISSAVCLCMKEHVT